MPPIGCQDPGIKQEAIDTEKKCQENKPCDYKKVIGAILDPVPVTSATKESNALAYLSSYRNNRHLRPCRPEYAPGMQKPVRLKPEGFPVREMLFTVLKKQEIAA